MASTFPSPPDYAFNPLEGKCDYHYEYEEEEDGERARILYQQPGGPSKSNLSDNDLSIKDSPLKYPFNLFTPPNRKCDYRYEVEEEEEAELAHFLYQQAGGPIKSQSSHDGASNDNSVTVAVSTQALANPPPSQPSDRFKVFTPFPRLPAEIRHKTWTLTLHGPQVLHILYDTNIRGETHYTYLDYEVDYHGTWRFANGIQIPVALHVVSGSAILHSQNL